MIDCYISDRTMINTLFSHWNNKRKDSLYPTKESIKEEELMEIWEYCFIIDVIEEKGDKKYHCSYIGERAKEIYKSDVNLYHRVDSYSTIPNVIEKLSDYLDEVIDSQEPVIDCSETESADGHSMKIHQCLLPLTITNDTVDCIIGVVGEKIY